MKSIGKLHYFMFLNICYSEYQSSDDLEINFTFLLHNKMINFIIPQQIKVENSGNGNLEFPVLVDLLFKF